MIFLGILFVNNRDNPYGLGVGIVSFGFAILASDEFFESKLVRIIGLLFLFIGPIITAYKETKVPPTTAEGFEAYLERKSRRKWWKKKSKT